MRGTETCLVKQIIQLGITPAHAGNSFALHLHHFALQDHPRSCGEQLRAGLTGETEPGSPPLMRGTVGCYLRGQDDVGITPAHAGNRI